MPPVKVLWPDSCRLPPPATLIALLALVRTEVMISVGCNGATFWPLKVIGLTVIDGEATSFRFTVPPVSDAFVDGLLDEAVIEPLVSVRMPVLDRRRGGAAVVVVGEAGEGVVHQEIHRVHALKDARAGVDGHLVCRRVHRGHVLRFQGCQCRSRAVRRRCRSCW